MFAHNPESKMLVVELSDFGLPVGMLPFGQLYDDACDEGFAIYNHRTGSTTFWHTAADVRDADGDLTTWILQPTTESCRKHPGVQNYTMHILND
jgi:hypothetical protein